MNKTFCDNCDVEIVTSTNNEFFFNLGMSADLRISVTIQKREGNFWELPDLCRGCFRQALTHAAKEP